MMDISVRTENKRFLFFLRVFDMFLVLLRILFRRTVSESAESDRFTTLCLATSYHLPMAFQIGDKIYFGI